MATVLNLGSLDLNDGTYYQLVQGWAPRVAKRRRSLMGGRGPYEDVVENIPVRVFGTTAALCLAAVQDIVEALDQASVWARGGNASAVLVKYLPDGTSLGTALEAACLGTPDSAPSMVNFTPEYDTTLAEFQLFITIPLVRRGAWLGAAENHTSQSTRAEMASVATCTFSGGATDFPSPHDLVIDFAAHGTGLEQGDPTGYILVSGKGTNGLHIIEAEDIYGGKFADQSSHNDASGNNFSRYTPTGTTERSLKGFASTIFTAAQCVGVFAMLRNNSSTYSFLVRAAVGIADDQQDIYTRYTVIDTSSQNPRPVFLGSVAIPPGATVNNAQFLATAENIADTLDIDYLVLMDMDNAAAIYFESPTDAAKYDNLNIEARAGSQLSPRLFFDMSGGGSENHRAYRGDAFLSLEGATVGCVLMMPYTTSWRMDDQFGADVSVLIESTRRPVYLSPR